MKKKILVIITIIIVASYLLIFRKMSWMNLSIIQHQMNMYLDERYSMQTSLYTVKYDQEHKQYVGYVVVSETGVEFKVYKSLRDNKVEWGDNFFTQCWNEQIAAEIQNQCRIYHISCKSIQVEDENTQRIIESGMQISKIYTEETLPYWRKAPEVFYEQAQKENESLIYGVQLFIEKGEGKQVVSLIKWIIDLPINLGRISITNDDSYIVLEYKDIQTIRAGLNSVEEYYEESLK